MLLRVTTMWNDGDGGSRAGHGHGRHGQRHATPRTQAAAGLLLLYTRPQNCIAFVGQNARSNPKPELAHNAPPVFGRPLLTHRTHAAISRARRDRQRGSAGGGTSRPPGLIR